MGFNTFARDRRSLVQRIVVVRYNGTIESMSNTLRYRCITCDLLRARCLKPARVFSWFDPEVTELTTVLLVSEVGVATKSVPTTSYYTELGHESYLSPSH